MDNFFPTKRELLSGKELVLARIDEPNLVLPQRGQKETVRNDTDAGRDQIANLYANLKRFISLERIDRRCNRSRGIWDPEQKTIEVVAKEGNWDIFGYVKNQIQYLKPFEALHLMEMNRLEVYFNSVIVSLEQGYHIFLNIPESIPEEQYIVYSKLMRSGYILFRSKDCEPDDSTCKSKTDYIWIYLNDLLKNTTSHRFSKNPEYSEAKNSMSTIIENTKNAVFQEEGASESVDWTTAKCQQNKRKLETWSESANKKFKNDLMDDCPEEFKNIFKQIDFIKLNKPNYDDVDDCNLEFAFNCYLPNRKHFKKSNLSRPDYRIIIWNDPTQLPNITHLGALCFRQTYRVPIIVIFLSKFYNFNAYFYYFS